MKFREFVEQQDDAPKLWSAKKDEIIELWKKLRPDIPIIMNPMYKTPEGKTRAFGQSGVRISGDHNFVLSILARLKDLLSYESENSNLRLIFKEIDTRHSGNPTSRSYVLYINRNK